MVRPPLVPTQHHSTHSRRHNKGRRVVVSIVTLLAVAAVAAFLERDWVQSHFFPKQPRGMVEAAPTQTKPE